MSHFHAIRSVQELVGQFFTAPSGDFADRLSARVTVIVLGFFSAILLTSHYWGEPINCWVPAEYPSGWAKFVDQYCYVHGTYYVPLSHPLPWDGNVRRQVPILYYQWVPYVLAVQAFFFYFPRLIWKCLCTFCGIDIVSLTSHYNQLWSELHENAENYSNRLLTIENVAVPQFADALRLYRKRQFRIILPICYLFCKILHCINALLQWFWLNEFLSSRKYRYWGFSILRDLWQGRDWQITGHFPRVTHCDFTRRRPASFQLDTVLCVLNLNLYYEKIFLLLWFWILLTALVNFMSLFYWLWVLGIPFNSLRFIKRYIAAVRHDQVEKMQYSHSATEIQPPSYFESIAEDRSEKQQIETFVEDMLCMDGVFILRLLSVNIGELPTAYITKALYQRYLSVLREQNHKPDFKTHSVVIASDDNEGGTVISPKMQISSISSTEGNSQLRSRLSYGIEDAKNI